MPPGASDVRLAQAQASRDHVGHMEGRGPDRRPRGRDGGSQRHGFAAARAVALLSGKGGRTDRDARRREFRRHPRGGPPHDRDAALRRAAARRCGARQGGDRGDADGRGKDARGHAAAGALRAVWPRRAPGHRKRLPREPRRRVDEADLRGAGPERGDRAGADGFRGAACSLRLRRDLRHGRRIRV